MKKAVVIEPNGDWEIVEFSDATFLSTFQKAVDGLVQPIDVRADLTMWVNEEFLFRNDLKYNIAGTAFFEEAGGEYNIAGTVALTGATDGEGYTNGVSDKLLEVLIQIAKVHKERLAEFNLGS